MRHRLYLMALPLLLALGACATAAQSAEPVLRQLLTDGKITQEQFDALMAALANSGGEDWLSIVGKIGGVLATIVFSYLGITKAPTVVKALKAPKPTP